MSIAAGSHADPTIRVSIRAFSKDRHGAMSAAVHATATKPIFGNFRRYYHIRNPASAPVSTNDTESIHPALSVDSRVASILAFLRRAGSSDEVDFVPIRDVLDIGCNSGKVTIQLAQTLPCVARAAAPLNITGVDIDPFLVAEAKENAATARSLYWRARDHGRVTENPVTSAALPSSAHLPTDAVSFPSVFPALFGKIQQPGRARPDARPSKRAKHASDLPFDVTSQLQPPQLEFLAAEWVTLGKADLYLNAAYEPLDQAALKQRDGKGYDMVLALSLTKWIHIHHGDAGLLRFFARISRCLRPGGILILERQEWKSYDAARGMSKEMRAKVKALRVRPEGDFDWMLESIGLSFVEKIGVGIGTGFKRPLEVFKKPALAASPDKLVFVQTCLSVTSESYSPFLLPWVTRPP
ncbi:Bin3-domain-containing protein [Testicularia cyperi]|uniref:RNA methyltransferase n=1 Tax=Testicularia cyperi TaxID=1882483 RepID=A0A317XHP3_9BASI|nr:Bin3-domain-containing protein [Testicularia cyperi]